MNRKIATTLSLITGIFFAFSTTMAAEQAKRPSARIGTSAQKLGAPTGVIIPCPSKLHGVKVEITTQYTAPSGWTQDWDKYTGYSGQTLVVESHSVSSGKLFCVYAKNTSPMNYRLTHIYKTIPAGTTCTAVSGYKFSCKKN